MKKVYSHIAPFLIVFFVTVEFFLEMRKEESFLHFAELLFSSLIFLFFFRTVFFPYWSYSEDGFQILIFQRERKFYKWSDVKEIKVFSGLDCFSLLVDGDKAILLGYLFTKDYPQVASNVIRFLNEKNEKVKIPSTLVKRLKDLNE